QGLVGQVLHRVLLGRGGDAIRRARIVHDRIGWKAELARRRDDPAAPVAEGIAIRRDGDRRVGDEVIRNNEVGDTRKMDVYRQYHRHWLGAVVEVFVADPDVHKDPSPVVTQN